MASGLSRRILARHVSLLGPRYVPRVSVIRVSLSDSCTFPRLFKRSSVCACNRLVYQVKPRYYSTPEKCPESDVPKEKLSIFQRFKEMYRNYWYVLVPVHLVTSACWFGGFYYLAKSGIDIVALLESWNFSERITGNLRDSSMGYLAISYALYKIATPLRYTVTLGGTTVSINYLKKWGYLKPVPSTEKLKEMYKVRKETLLFSVKDKTDELKMKKEKLKDHTDQFITKIQDSQDSVLGRNIGKELKK